MTINININSNTNPPDFVIGSSVYSPITMDYMVTFVHKLTKATVTKHIDPQGLTIEAALMALWLPGTTFEDITALPYRFTAKPHPSFTDKILITPLPDPNPALTEKTWDFMTGKNYYPSNPTPAPDWMTVKGVWGTAAPAPSPSVAELKAKLNAIVAQYANTYGGATELKAQSVQAKRNATEVEDFCSRVWPTFGQPRCKAKWKCLAPYAGVEETQFHHGCHLPLGHAGDEHVCGNLSYSGTLPLSSLCSVLSVIGTDPMTYQVAFFDHDDPTKRRHVGPATLI